MCCWATFGTKDSLEALVEKKKTPRLKFGSNFKPKLELGFVIYCLATFGTKINNLEALAKNKKNKPMLKLWSDFKFKLELKFVMHHWITLGAETSSEAFTEKTKKPKLKLKSNFEPELELGFVMCC